MIILLLIIYVFLYNENSYCYIYILMKNFIHYTIFMVVLKYLYEFFILVVLIILIKFQQKSNILNNDVYIVKIKLIYW